MLTSPARAIHARNAVTYAGLLLGLGAIAAALRGRADAAGALVGLAVLADTFDGRFARYLAADEAQAEVGGELDSLCDACTFGMVPVVCTAALATPGRFDAWWWLAGGVYLICLLTRLAFYNVTRTSVPGFIGLPAPVAALIWSSALCVTQDADLLAVVLAAGGLAMIAPWRLPRPVGPALLLFALWPLLVVAEHLAAP